MKIRSLLYLTVLLSATFAKAQSFVLDCSCLATQSVLITNACQAVVPDLCQFTNCVQSTVVGQPPPMVTCSQSPAAGTPVGPGNHPITVTFSDSGGSVQSCLLLFTVNLPPGANTLLCAPNKTVECGTTWVFDPPVATNFCCPIVGAPGGVIITDLGAVTNGSCPEIITQTWQATDGCMNVATCSQKVTVVDTTPPLLNCSCLTNNPLAQIPMTVTNCADVIPDLCHAAFICAFDNCAPPTCSQTPAPNTPVGPGVHPITVTMTDCASNSTSCTVNFTVIAPSTGCSPCTNGTYNFLPVTIPGGNGVFTSPNGNGFITAQTAGGPFLGLNNTAYPAQFPNLFPASGTVQGYLAQADDNATFTTTFNLQNFTLSPQTVFGIWNITEECDLYKIEVFDSGNNLIPLTTGWNFYGYDDNAVFGNIGWYHMVLNKTTGLLCPTNFTAFVPGKADCDAAFWNNLPLNAAKIVVTGNLGPADGVVFYFAEPQPCCVTPPTGMVGWWPLDESCGATVFADLSGSGNAALVESGPLCSGGSPNAVPGKVAGAAYFYGPTVRGRASGPSLNFGTGNFSVDAWVNPVPVGSTTWQPIVDKLTQPTPTTAFGYAVGITNNRVELRVGNGTLTTLQSVNTVNFSAWNFVAVSVDRAGTVTFHVNGVNETPQSFAVAGSFNSTVDLLIGGTHDLNGPYGELTLDEVEVFNRAITNAEMTAIWTADRNGKCKPILPCTNSVVTIFCPPNQTASTCSNSAFVPYPPPSASTSCGFIVSIVCTPASGSSFPLGTTPVTCIATDSQGNTASCMFNVIVTPDLTPPSCPPTSMSITGCPPLMPNFATNGLITDNCTPVGQISVVQSPLPGTVLPPGLTSATILACDAAGNCRPCQILITAVYAGPLPVIICPTNRVAIGYQANVCGPGAGITLGYPLPQVSNGTLVGCTPPSGSLFPFGITTVTCVATNRCATNQCSFTVTVNTYLIAPPCTPPPPNMVMWLKFDETAGATAFNASSGNNGVLANGPTRTPGQYVVNTLCFDGVNDYVQVQPYAAMQFGTGDFTVDAWVKPATLANTVRITVDHREENGGVVRGYSLFLGGNNAIGFQIADGTFINYPFPNSVVPADGQWHFVAVTVKRNDPQGIRVYVDGIADPNPRDPTIHPGSVTAGPCYPFRVGSRSSSVSGLFPGCIDEVELFRRALSPSELQAIYDARCRGKCRIPCQGGDRLALSCWLPPAGNGTTIATIIYNPLPVPTTYTYTYVPVTGPGCAAPPSFSPATGTVLVPANSYYFPLPQVQVTFPGGLNPGDCACYKLIIATADGSQSVECHSRFCLPRGIGIGGGVCTDPFVPVIPLTNLEPAVVTFTLSGTGTDSTVLANPVIVLRSPEGLPVAVHPLPPITVPPAGGGTVQVSDSIAFPEYDPGRIYDLVLEADLDGDGTNEPLGLKKLLNVLPSGGSEPTLEIRRGPGGGIIITWPDPCATVEVNPNISNPAGWTPGPVQTSPWTFATTPTGGALFIRLRK